MTVREVREEEREQWNSFVLENPQGSFLQTWEWGEVESRMGRDIWRFVVEDEGKWMASVLLLRRPLPLGQCWLYGPFGPVISQNSKVKSQNWWLVLQRKLEEITGEERAVWVRLDAPFEASSPEGEPWRKKLEEQGWEKSEREVQPKETLVIDLVKSEEDLLADMKSKTRYNVRLAKKKGVGVRFSRDIADVELFWQLGQAVSERSGFQFHPKRYYVALLEQMNTGGGDVAAELAIAEHEGEVLAVHLMVYAAGKATYVHGASSDAKRSLMAPALVYWETIKRAKERGCTLYDFWGVAPAAAKAMAGKPHPWAGITRIKEGFGGRREVYTGAYDLVMQPWLYHMIEVARRIRRVVS